MKTIILVLCFAITAYSAQFEPNPRFLIGKENVQFPSKEFCEKMQRAYREPQYPHPWWYAGCADWRTRDREARKEDWKSNGPMRRYYHPYFRRVLDRLQEYKERRRRLDLAEDRILNNGF